MLEEIRTELELLATKIRRTKRDSQDFASLVDQYNDLIDDAMPLIMRDEPLPDKCLIESDLILPAYLKYQEGYNDEGPFTFIDYLETVDAIALARVIRVRKRGTLVSATISRLFKGDLQDSVQFYTPESWMPTEWYKKHEDSMIFLKLDKASMEYAAHGYISRMPIVLYSGEKHAKSYNPPSHFWQGFRSTDIDDPDWDKVTLIPFSELENLLR